MYGYVKRSENEFFILPLKFKCTFSGATHERLPYGRPVAVEIRAIKLKELKGS